VKPDTKQIEDEYEYEDDDEELDISAVINISYF
jgi:hypothetical protein